MKIVLWIGNEANQKALANKLNAVFPIAGIITETRKHKPKITLSKLFEKGIEKIFLPSIARAWWGMKAYYEKIYHNYPSVRTIDVENINCQAVYDFTKEINPDLILVSGTSLVKQKLLSVQPRIGIINLHTGLSPYLKGAPNCTNWCIATRQYHLIGNTVMWIDLGIDSGNIVTTEFTTLTGDEDLSAIHLKVMEHAHSLYLKAVSKIATGEYPNVKQDKIAKGITYYTKQWKLKEKINLIRNVKKLRQKIKSGEVEKLQQSVTTIKI